MPSRLKEYAGWYFRVNVRVRVFEEGVLHSRMGGLPSRWVGGVLRGCIRCSFRYAFGTPPPLCTVRIHSTTALHDVPFYAVRRPLPQSKTAAFSGNARGPNHYRSWWLRLIGPVIGAG